MEKTLETADDMHNLFIELHGEKFQAACKRITKKIKNSAENGETSVAILLIDEEEKFSNTLVCYFNNMGFDNVCIRPVAQMLYNDYCIRMQF